MVLIEGAHAKCKLIKMKRTKRTATVVEQFLCCLLNGELQPMMSFDVVTESLPTTTRSGESKSEASRMSCWQEKSRNLQTIENCMSTTQKLPEFKWVERFLRGDSMWIFQLVMRLTMETLKRKLSHDCNVSSSCITSFPSSDSCRHWFVAELQIGHSLARRYVANDQSRKLFSLTFEICFAISQISGSPQLKPPAINYESAKWLQMWSQLASSAHNHHQRPDIDLKIISNAAVNYAINSMGTKAITRRWNASNSHGDTNRSNKQLNSLSNIKDAPRFTMPMSCINLHDAVRCSRRSE